MAMIETPGEGISVIVPTRNRVARLAGAIRSIRSQTLKPLEIVVVDDASTDATPSFLAGLVQRGDERSCLRVIRSERQGGASHARNLGIAASRGKMLAFLDDDDRWMPDKLAVQSVALRNASPRVGLVCCAYRVVLDRVGRVVKTWHPPAQPMDLRYFLRTTGFMTSVPLLHRACFEQIGGFDERLSGGQDLDMWIRIAERFDVLAAGEILAEHVIHGEQITTNLPAKARAGVQILNKHRARLAAHPDLLGRHLKRAALLLCAAGEAETGRAYLAEALALSPSCDELRSHLELSRRNSREHSARLIANAFPTVDGIRLFY